MGLEWLFQRLHERGRASKPYQTANIGCPFCRGKRIVVTQGHGSVSFQQNLFMARDAWVSQTGSFVRETIYPSRHVEKDLHMRSQLDLTKGLVGEAS